LLLLVFRSPTQAFLGVAVVVLGVPIYEVLRAKTPMATRSRRH
jgi:putative effector of murein hydrolase